MGAATTTHTTTTTTMTEKPVACAVLQALSTEQYDVGDCAHLEAGSTCIVTCNSDNGYVGNPDRFSCLADNLSFERSPMPETDWPKCELSSAMSIGLLSGITGGIVGVLALIAALLCPGGICHFLR